MIDGLNHLTLSVRSIPRAFAFYRDILGLRPVMRSARSAYFRAGRTWIALVEEAGAVPSTSYAHAAFNLPAGEFAAFIARLRGAGIREWQENRTEGESIYFLDDSGNRLEIHCASLEDRIRAGKLDWDGPVEWFE